MPASDGAEVPGEFGWVSRVSLTEDRLPPSPVRGTQFAHRAGLEWVRSRLKTIIDYEPRSCQVFKSVRVNRSQTGVSFSRSAADRAACRVGLPATTLRAARRFPPAATNLLDRALFVV